MRRLLIALLLLCAPAFAADYYAGASCAAGNMSTCDWNTTSTGSCTSGGGSALTWASRLAGDVLHANGCVGITVDANPGLGAGQNLTLSTVAGTGTAGGTFVINTSSALSLNANIIAGSAATPALTVSGSTGSLAITGTLTGGSAASAAAVSATHTVVTVTVTGNLLGGSSSSSATGMTLTSASGLVVINGNVVGGTAAPGFTMASTGGTAAATINGNCVGSDTASGTSGCQGTNANTGGIITLTKSVVAGKFAPGIVTGKFYFAPGSTASAVYFAINSTYTSADIVDANYDIEVSPTLTNAYVAPLAYATTGIGNTAKVVTGTVYGPYTGTAATGGNSGSAH